MTKPDLRRVLSIRQPWAHLIIRPDLPAGSPERQAWLDSPARKDIENRTKPHSYRGEVFIHAGLKEDEDAVSGLSYVYPELAQVIADASPGGKWDQRGGIIGKAQMTGVVRAHPSRWFHGPVGWVMADPEPVPFEPLRGLLGIFVAGDVPLTKAQIAKNQTEWVEKNRDQIKEVLNGTD